MKCRDCGDEFPPLTPDFKEWHCSCLDKCRKCKEKVGQSMMIHYPLHHFYLCSKCNNELSSIVFPVITEVYKKFLKYDID